MSVWRAIASRSPAKPSTLSSSTTRSHWPKAITAVSPARRGANIVFSHDDAFPISGAFADRLAAHLEQVDIVGIAGATAALSGFWGYAGQPHTHGHVVASAPEGSHVDLLVWGAASRRVDGIRLLDGCMIAARRDVAVAIGFDAQRFDGFHLYDADFSLRASTAGRTAAVVSDITVYHRSVGDFDADWHRYHEIFLAAHAASWTASRRNRGGSRGFPSPISRWRRRKSMSSASPI